MRDTMGRDWEDTLRRWAKPLSDTEQTKCENAERMIRSAIDESTALNARKIEVFIQGSYQNNTNVRTESDVDVCILCSDTLYCDLSQTNGLSKSDVGIIDATYLYPQYKNEVEQALIAKFGKVSVSRGNKAIDVHANSYRVDADVVACFEYRLYRPRQPDGTVPCELGTSFPTDDDTQLIYNWPRQNYANGVSKNKATGSRFKYMVRAIKRLKIDMEDNGVKEARNVPSFLIESLLWNVPDNRYGHDWYSDDVRTILAYLYDMTSTNSKCSEWGEVNEIKYLFRPSQPWTREGANAFISSAQAYTGLK